MKMKMKTEIKNKIIIIVLFIVMNYARLYTRVRTRQTSKKVLAGRASERKFWAREFAMRSFDSLCSPLVRNII